MLHNYMNKTEKYFSDKLKGIILHTCTTYIHYQQVANYILYNTYYIAS